MGVTVTVARSAGCSRCPRGGRSAAIVRSRVRWPPLRSRRRFLCDHAIASGCSRARRSPRASSLAACRALSAASMRSRARQLPSRPLRRLLCAQAHGGCYAATVIAVSVLSLARPHAARRGGRHGRSARTGGCCQCAAPTVRPPPPQLRGSRGKLPATIISLACVVVRPLCLGATAPLPHTRPHLLIQTKRSLMRAAGGPRLMER